MDIQNTNETETAVVVASAETQRALVEQTLDDMRGIRNALISDYRANRLPESGASAIALGDAIQAGILPDNDETRAAIKSATVQFNRDDATALRNIDRVVSVLRANALAAIAQVSGIADEHSLALVARQETTRALRAMLNEQDERAAYRLVWFERDATDAQETGIAGKSIGEIHAQAIAFTQEHTTGKWRNRAFAIMNAHNVPQIFLRDGKRVPRPTSVK